MNLTPYLKDYKSKKEITDDFFAGKDFILNDISSPWDGKPINKDSVPAGELIQVRYAKLQKVTTFTA